jgi:hypothetical protein
MSRFRLKNSSSCREIPHTRFRNRHCEKSVRIRPDFFAPGLRRLRIISSRGKTHHLTAVFKEHHLTKEQKL